MESKFFNGVNQKVFIQMIVLFCSDMFDNRKNDNLIADEIVDKILNNKTAKNEYYYEHETDKFKINFFTSQNLEETECDIYVKSHSQISDLMFKNLKGHFKDNATIINDSEIFVTSKMHFIDNFFDDIRNTILIW